ncbi:MAG: hypothetical protein UY35_C0010G0013 [Candidatus Saccharibacteria bacterium GW2011_GWC2_48_9]|nr:MAG: hypothetical protein UY35_C0010G0013 [Candidatus Saccharibacteria bacterium GW2011_GWC2_48_9]HCH34017.1 hypothetical protein [Candidatus Saccharibacteria bacterium]
MTEGNYVSQIDLLRNSAKTLESFSLANLSSMYVAQDHAPYALRMTAFGRVYVIHFLNLGPNAYEVCTDDPRILRLYHVEDEAVRIKTSFCDQELVVNRPWVIDSRERADDSLTTPPIKKIKLIQVPRFDSYPSFMP